MRYSTQYEITELKGYEKTSYLSELKKKKGKKDNTDA